VFFVATLGKFRVLKSFLDSSDRSIGMDGKSSGRQWDAAEHVGGQICCEFLPPGAGPQDQRVVGARNDVLAFTTPAFTEDLEVTGPVSLDLFASTSVVDTDFTAKLVDVWPDGFAQNLTEGIVRLRYRNSREKPELANPGEIYRFNAGLACEFQARPGSQNPVVLNTWARSEIDFISSGESGL